MPTPVPVSDLPPDLRGTAVPASDLPRDLASPSSGKSVPVTAMEEPKTALDYAKDIGSAALNLTPAGHAVKTIHKGMEVADKALYDTGGWVTDKAAKVLPPEAAAALGFGTNLAGQFLLGGGGAGAGQAAGKTITKGLESGARTLMQSAMKPTSADLVAGKADRAITTALEKEFIPTREGIAKLRGEIDTLMTRVEEAIANNADKTVDQASVVAGIRPVFEKFKNSIEEATRSTDIHRALNDFMGHPWIKAITPQPARTVESKIVDASGKPFEQIIPASGTGKIPVQEAQAIKQGIYRDIGEKAYGPKAMPDSEQAARKAMAAKLRTGIEDVVPEVIPLNKQAGDLINLGNVATRRAMMDANKNPLGLGLLAHNPLALAAFEAERSPIIKAHLAHLLNRNAASAQPFGRAIGAITGASAGSHSGSKGEDDL